MHYVGQHRSVHLFVFRPIGAVHVRHVEIIALVAPAFIEDLFELLFRIEIHAQVNIKSARTRRWRRSIRINNKKRGSRGPTTKGCGTASATASRAIDELVTIRADFICSDTVDERCGFSIAQAITDQLAAATTAKASSATLSARRCFQVVNYSVDAGMQL